MQKGMRNLRLLYDGGPPAGWDLKGQGGLMTYSVASMILFYEALYNEPPPAKARRALRRAEEAQLQVPEGGRGDRPLPRLLARREAGGAGLALPGRHRGRTRTSRTRSTRCSRSRPRRAAGSRRPPTSTSARSSTSSSSQEKDGPRRAALDPEPGVRPRAAEDRYGPFIRAGRTKARGWEYLARPTSRSTGQHDDRGGRRPRDREGAPPRAERAGAGDLAADRPLAGRRARLALQATSPWTRTPARADGTTTTSTGSSASGAFTGLTLLRASTTGTARARSSC